MSSDIERAREFWSVEELAGYRSSGLPVWGGEGYVFTFFMPIDPPFGDGQS